MSKLEELIQKYCPDGVEWEPLGNYLSYEQPTKYLVESTKYDDSFPTPVLTAGQTFVLGFTKETTGLFEASEDNPVIIFDDFTTSFHWVEFSFKVKSSAMKMLRPVDEKKALFRYLYYCMKNILYVPGDHTRQWIGTYSLFEIPIPPLPVQEEIVRVLDTFTELQAELQVEQQKRKQQYNYYRDNLLSFEGRKDVQWKHLGDICDIKGRIGFRGYTREDQVKEGEGALSLSPSNISDGQMDYSKGTYITWFKYEESPEIMTFNGDIIFCKTASVGKVALVKNLPCKATINPQLVVLKNIKCKVPFLAYVLETNYVQNKVIAMAGVGSVPNISQKALSEIEIPIPSMDEQQRIVDILDKFNTLANDLAEGLPYEIEKRRQQYEFYRDKLLTFKRKES